MAAFAPRAAETRFSRLICDICGFAKTATEQGFAGRYARRSYRGVFDASKGVRYNCGAVGHGARPLRISSSGLAMATNRIERVLRHDGIVAVLDQTAEQAQGGEPSWVGDDKWKPIVMEAVKLRQIANEPSVRVLVGDHAVLVSGDEKHVVGVVFIKGHPVVKSVVRMVRQLLRQPNPAPQGL